MPIMAKAWRNWVRSKTWTAFCRSAGLCIKNHKTHTLFGHIILLLGILPEKTKSDE